MSLHTNFKKARFLEWRITMLLVEYTFPLVELYNEKFT